MLLTIIISVMIAVMSKLNSTTLCQRRTEDLVSFIEIKKWMQLVPKVQSKHYCVRHYQLSQR